MGFARLSHSLLGAAAPLAIVACLLSAANSVAVSFALIGLALVCRLWPQRQPFSLSVSYPALLFALLPLLQAIPLPEFLWRRLTAVDTTLQAEVAQLGAVLLPTWSFEPAAAVHSSVIAIAALAVFLLARHAAKRPCALWSAILLLTAVAAWQAIEGLSQHFAGLLLLEDGEFAHGSFINRGYYAAFLNAAFWLAIGAAYSQALRPDKSLARTVLALGFVFTALGALAAIAASQSRSAMLVLSLLALAAMALAPLSRQKRAVLALGAAGCAGMFLSSAAAAPLVERFRQLYEQGGDPGRWLIWRDSLAALTPFGSGAGSFPWAFERSTPYFLRKSVDTAHSDYIEWAVEFGPWFAGVFALALAFAVARLLRQAQGCTDAERRALALGAAFGAGALALHALTDSVLHSPTLLFLLACLLGLGYGLTASIPTQRQRLGAALLAAGLCTSTLLLAGGVNRWSVAPLFSAARESQLRADLAAARSAYAEALRANPRAAPAWMALAEMARFQGDISSSLKYLRNAHSVDPYTYRVEWALADLQLATGDVAGGVETLRAICEQLTDLRPAAYLLAYRAGAPLELIERRLTAPEAYAVGEYLAFLVRSGNLHEVNGAYERLVVQQNVQLSEAHQRYLADHAGHPL